MDEKFWKVRRCMLEPVPEIFDAAKLLSAAADFHVAGNENDARDALMAADRPAIPDWCEQLWGGRGGLGNVPTDVETRAEVGAPSLERQARGVKSGREATP